MNDIPENIQNELDKEFERMEIESEREDDDSYQEFKDQQALRNEM